MINKLLIAAALLLFVVCGCEDPMSPEQFDEVQIDIVQREVPYDTEIKMIPSASGFITYQCDTYVRPNGEIYLIHKFRSMINDAEKESGPVWTQNDDDRVTRVGRFIRRWRIDELPQLWNVLKGEMSFVGPRPERDYFVKELQEIIPYYSVRLTVKPGITGWAQICYRYGASVEDAVEKLNYDLFYIKNMSALMDLMIVLRTIKIVLFGRGAR